MRGNPMLEKLDKQLIAKIKGWLNDEVGSTFKKEILEEVSLDMMEDDDLIHFGRRECAESLLEQINKWEKENKSMENIC